MEYANATWHYEKMLTSLLGTQEITVFHKLGLLLLQLVDFLLELVLLLHKDLSKKS